MSEMCRPTGVLRGNSTMAKLWAGRFQKETDLVVNDFNSSILFDCRLYKEDITGSIAHATMLGRQGIIEEHEAEKIVEGLKGILKDIEEGNVEFSLDYEDIHMNVEQLLTERIGDTGKRLHTGRSRNDQVALDMRLYVKKEIKEIIELILGFMKALTKKSRENLDAVMPGYTHLQRAQPTTFAHYMMAYANMLKRDITRLQDCYERMDEMPLGSGALASTTYPIDRDFVREQLGFARLTDNSLDGVSDRDYCVELLSALSILMMHLSRLSEEIISWCSWEFKFVELDDAYSTGSSIMPQKKNPDIAELTRGKSGRLIGDLTGLLATLKGLPTAYARDLQEDKEAVFDQVDTLEVLLPAFTGMVATMVFDKERLEAEAPTGFALATDIAEWLVKNGVPFRHAHELSGACVKIAEDRGQELWDLTDEDFINVFKDFLPADKAPQVREVLSTEGSVSARNGKGGTSPLRVREQIVSAKTTIEQLRAFANSVSDGSAYKSPESLLK